MNPVMKLGLGAILAFALAAGAVLCLSGTAEFEREVRALAASGARVDLGAFVPPPAREEENAGPLYVQAFAHVSGSGTDTRIAPEGLALLDRAVRKPRCRFGFDYAQGFAADEPHTRLLHRCAAAVSESAREDLARGDSAAIVEKIRLMAMLAGATRDSASMFSHLNRHLHIEFMFSLFRPDQIDLSKEGWEQLSSVFDDSSLSADYLRALEYERAVGISLFTRDGRRGLGSGLHQRLRASLADSGVPHDELATHNLRVMNRVVELGGRPFHVAHAEELRLDQEIRDFAKESGWPSGMVNFMSPFFVMYHRSLAGAQARLALCRAACLLKSMESYPERLEAADPFTGRPMPYRREGPGFRLYSVGENLVDDGMGADDVGIVATH
jgi:hypothetical protein